MVRFAALITSLAAFACGTAAPVVDGGARRDGGLARDGGGRSDGGPAADAGPRSPLDSRPLLAGLRGAVARTSDPAAQRSLVDRFMSDLSAAGGAPVRGAGELTFLYRGTATGALSVSGGFEGGATPRFFARVGMTDLYTASAAAPNGARFEYTFHDGARAFHDPHNGFVAWDGVASAGRGGFVSVVMMPEHLPTAGVLSHQRGAREVFLYLPAAYFREDARYFPTLSFHDGNEAVTRGQLDRVAEALIDAGTIPPMVIVFIDVDAERRAFDYAIGPATGGTAYVTFLQMTLLPELERGFRLSTAERALAGADLGGLVTFHAARVQIGAFWTRFGAHSPRFEWDSQRLVADFRDGPAVAGSFYFDGEAEGAAADARRAMSAALSAKSYDARYAEQDGGAPSWSEWRVRFGDLLRHFYGAGG